MKRTYKRTFTKAKEEPKSKPVMVKVRNVGRKAFFPKKGKPIGQGGTGFVSKEESNNLYLRVIS